MKKDPWTHVYGIVGIVPGIISLVIAWKATSPWSEYLLMASGWFAAFVYACLLLRSISTSNSYAERCGQSEVEYRLLEEKALETKQRHDDEMKRRAATLDYLAGIAMAQQPPARQRRVLRGSTDDN